MKKYFSSFLERMLTSANLVKNAWLHTVFFLDSNSARGDLPFPQSPNSGKRSLYLVGTVPEPLLLVIAKDKRVQHSGKNPSLGRSVVQPLTNALALRLYLAVSCPTVSNEMAGSCCSQ